MIWLQDWLSFQQPLSIALRWIAAFAKAIFVQKIMSMQLVLILKTMLGG